MSAQTKEFNHASIDILVSPVSDPDRLMYAQHSKAAAIVRECGGHTTGGTDLFLGDGSFGGRRLRVAVPADELPVFLGLMKRETVPGLKGEDATSYVDETPELGRHRIHNLVIRPDNRFTPV